MGWIKVYKELGRVKKVKVCIVKSSVQSDLWGLQGSSVVFRGPWGLQGPIGAQGVLRRFQGFLRGSSGVQGVCRCFSELHWGPWGPKGFSLVF